MIAGVVAIVIATPSTASATGSLALGHPALGSEAVASDGVVQSRVPDVARAASDETLVTFAPHAKAHLEALIRAAREWRSSVR